MTEIKVYCDHCGKELDEMSDYVDLHIKVAHRGVTTDLCTSCFKKLAEAIYDYCGKGDCDNGEIY